jgi:hypothetical protein
VGHRDLVNGIYVPLSIINFGILLVQKVEETMAACYELFVVMEVLYMCNVKKLMVPVVFLL